MAIVRFLIELTRIANKFRRDRNGGVAIIFGLSMIPTLGFVAVAIDYGILLHAKTRLDAAADAASMVAITTAQNIITGSPSSSSVTAQAVSAGQAQAQAQKSFAANAGNVAYTVIPTPVVNLSRNNQTLTATVSYATTTKANLVTVLGISTMNFRGTSTSTVTMPTYINYYIITDISQSMGVAATPTDMQALYDRVIKFSNYDSQGHKDSKIGCVFGCHVQQAGGGYTQPDSNENLAHNTAKYGSRINLRIDSAISAIQAVLTDASNANTSAGLNLIKIGLYTMQQDPTKSGSYIQNIVSPPNSNFTSTSTAATAIDLGNNTGGGIGDTSFSNSLSTFYNNVLTTQGDGSSPSSPLNYVFLVTDGLSDVPGSCTSGHCTAALDPSLCSNLKLKSTVGVIYTTYNPIYKQNNSSLGFEDNYAALVAPYVDSIAGNLKSCTQDPTTYYYEASDGPAITTGMQKLFASSSQTARLSN